MIVDIRHAVSHCGCLYVVAGHVCCLSALDLNHFHHHHGALPVLCDPHMLQGRWFLPSHARSLAVPPCNLSEEHGLYTSSQTACCKDAVFFPARCKGVGTLEMCCNSFGKVVKRAAKRIYAVYAVECSGDQFLRALVSLVPAPGAHMGGGDSGGAYQVP